MPRWCGITYSCSNSGIMSHIRLLAKTMPKAYVLEDRIMGKSYCLTKFSVMTVGRNPRCDISTLNPKTLDPVYNDEQKQIAGHVSGVHFHISYESDGNIYVWDNKSSNGLYIKLKDEEEVIRILKKTRIFPGTGIFASTEYKFFLREEKIDLQAQKRAEERASTDTTQILRQSELIR